MGTRDRRGWKAAGPVMSPTMVPVAGSPFVAPAGPASVSGGAGWGGPVTAAVAGQTGAARASAGIMLELVGGQCLCCFLVPAGATALLRVGAAVMRVLPQPGTAWVLVSRLIIAGVGLVSIGVLGGVQGREEPCSLLGGVTVSRVLTLLPVVTILSTIARGASPQGGMPVCERLRLPEFLLRWEE